MWYVVIVEKGFCFEIECVDYECIFFLLCD